MCIYRLFIFQIILLVYEHITATKTKAEKGFNGKELWQTLMNNTFNRKRVDDKMILEKFGLEPKSLHIIPILLKALKHNKYLEKIIKETTLPREKKNIYEINTMNEDTNTPFLKTRLYSFVYKRSPFFTSNIRNVNYYTRSIKIKQDKRFLDYFYNKIHSKFDVAHIKPNFENMFTKINVETDKKISLPEKINNKDVIEKTNKTTKAKLKQNCKCSKHIQEILKKYVPCIDHVLLPVIHNTSNNIQTAMKNLTQKTQQFYRKDFNDDHRPHFESSGKLNINSISSILKNNQNMTSFIINNKTKLVDLTNSDKRKYVNDENQLYFEPESNIDKINVVNSIEIGNKLNYTNQPYQLFDDDYTDHNLNNITIYDNKSKNLGPRESIIISNITNPMSQNRAQNLINITKTSKFTKEEPFNHSTTSTTTTTRYKNFLKTSTDKAVMRKLTRPKMFEYKIGNFSKVTFSDYNTRIISYDYYDDPVNTMFFINKEEEQQSGTVTPEILTKYSDSDFSKTTSESTETANTLFNSKEVTKTTIEELLYKRPSYLNIQFNQWWQDEDNNKNYNDYQ